MQGPLSRVMSVPIDGQATARQLFALTGYLESLAIGADGGLHLDQADRPMEIVRSAPDGVGTRIELQCVFLWLRLHFPNLNESFGIRVFRDVFDDLPRVDPARSKLMRATPNPTPSTGFKNGWRGGPAGIAASGDEREGEWLRMEATS